METRENVRGIVATLIRSGSEKALMDALDCDAYTVAGDLRALDGLGWSPCELWPAERAAIMSELDRRDSARAIAGDA